MDKTYALDEEGYVIVIFEPEISKGNLSATPASGGRVVGNSSLVDIFDEDQWEKEYERIMDKKYAKGTRKFTKISDGLAEERPLIYLIPRERGGPSYKDVKLKGTTVDKVRFCPISKGFPMQDVSSFTLGPIVGEGLCLVNAAFSKIICVHHIEGCGSVDLNRKNFWKRARKPTRKVEIVDENCMLVDNVGVNIYQWLKENEDLWLEQWEVWRRNVAMSSIGGFHWGDGSPTIAFRYKGEYIDFVEWKKKCYIGPSYELLPNTEVFTYLEDTLQKNIPLGLVHPKAKGGETILPMTKKYIKELFNSQEMCCQPYVIAGKLLGVSID